MNSSSRRLPSARRPGRFLPLPAADRPVSPPPPVARRTPALWLCLYLPRLPLEAQPGLARHPGPVAIVRDEGRHTRVVTTNVAARDAGVRCGMPVSSALALAPALRLSPREPALEAATLARLARWAGRFTPVVVIDPDGALLLEVRGSLRLFHGLEALRAVVAGQLAAFGHEAVLTSAPTARAAVWLARAGQGLPDSNQAGGEALRQALAAVPVACLGWPARTVQGLGRMGIDTVGDCLRLPREGFARRFGAGRLHELDQALGRAPDPREAHVPAVRFEARLELPAETTDAALLLAGGRQLLQELRQVLVTRQATVRRLWCRLVHDGQEETRLCLVLHQAAGPAVGPLATLLRLRLEGLVLPGPVRELKLQADLEPAAPAGGRDLLGQELRPGDSLAGLVDRLRARLGWHSVQGLALRAEHRPEHAWQGVPEPAASRAAEPPLVSRSRPLWLLPVPARLGLVAGQPGWQGPLRLEGGPERIESGWWDGGDVRRDYYRASNPRGLCLWVYQDLRSQGWYLHGVFG